jgi:aryl-alcohol dehydrogenase-like predicted oxidoreductase
LFDFVHQWRKFMLYRKIGNTELNASVIAIGTWVMGGWMWGGAQEKESISAIHAAFDNGINFIDTAPVYGFGVSEEVVGKALRSRRDKVILATKCGLRWDIEKGDFHFNSTITGIKKEESDLNVYKYLGAESILQEVEWSLKRLQTDYIDLYQTHWQDSTTPIEETMSALMKLKEQGKIRAIGISNASVEQLQAYGPIDSDQEKFNMFHREIEKKGNVGYCMQHGIASLAYSPLAQGLLTGKISPERKFKEGDLRLADPLFAQDNLRKTIKFSESLVPLTEEYHCSLAQLASAWTFHHPGITHLLCGARTPAQAVENAGAGDIRLSEAAIAAIDQLFAKFFIKK